MTKWLPHILYLYFPPAKLWLSTSEVVVLVLSHMFNRRFLVNNYRASNDLFIHSVIYLFICHSTSPVSCLNSFSAFFGCFTCGHHSLQALSILSRQNLDNAAQWWLFSMSTSCLVFCELLSSAGSSFHPSTVCCVHADTSCWQIISNEQISFCCRYLSVWSYTSLPLLPPHMITIFD